MKPFTFISVLAGLAASAQAAVINRGEDLSTRTIPSNLPQVILPSNPGSIPANTSPIQIAFLSPLNYEFVAGNPTAAAQIFTRLPQALAAAANINVNSVYVEKLTPYDTQASLGYITTLAKVRYPTNLVQTLRTDIKISNSALYTLQDATLRSLTAQINPAIDILGNN
jgi:hypothetical protein